MSSYVDDRYRPTPAHACWSTHRGESAGGCHCTRLWWKVWTKIRIKSCCHMDVSMLIDTLVGYFLIWKDIVSHQHQHLHSLHTGHHIQVLSSNRTGCVQFHGALRSVTVLSNLISPKGRLYRAPAGQLHRLYNHTGQQYIILTRSLLSTSFDLFYASILCTVNVNVNVNNHVELRVIDDHHSRLHKPHYYSSSHFPHLAAQTECKRAYHR